MPVSLHQASRSYGLHNEQHTAAQQCSCVRAPTTHSDADREHAKGRTTAVGGVCVLSAILTTAAIAVHRASVVTLCSNFSS
jgi:hypothetical protein